MSILKNFINPWELDNSVLKTNVLDTSVLENNVLNTSNKKKERKNPSKSGNIYFASDGVHLGNDNLSGNKVYIMSIPSNVICEKELECINNKFLLDLKKKGDNPDEYHIGSTDPIIRKLSINKTKFLALAGTIYDEGSSTELEAKGIFSVIKNRADYLNYTPYKVIIPSSKQGIYGYSHRDKITSVNASKSQVENAYKAVIEGLLSFQDTTNGAYNWHGKDFGISSWKAYKDYYKVGFLFTNNDHDLWNLGSKKSDNPNWEYKYESTAAEGGTTFMKLTDEWKTYNNKTKPW